MPEATAPSTLPASTTFFVQSPAASGLSSGHVRSARQRTTNRELTHASEGAALLSL
jgi:hypothetical protein